MIEINIYLEISVFFYNAILKNYKDYTLIKPKIFFKKLETIVFELNKLLFICEKEIELSFILKVTNYFSKYGILLLKL